MRTLDDQCPAGGPHTWVELTAYEAGPGWDRGGWRCDECGATPGAGPCPTCHGRGEMPHIHNQYCRALDCIDPCPNPDCPVVGMTADSGRGQRNNHERI